MFCWWSDYPHVPLGSHLAILELKPFSRVVRVAISMLLPITVKKWIFLLLLMLVVSMSIQLHSRRTKIFSSVSFRLFHQLDTNILGADGLALGGFGIDDILSQEDLTSIGESFDRLIQLFPSIERETLRRIATKSPYLLALTPDKLSFAVNRIKAELPSVDPSYVMSQRTLGVELLIHCISPAFNIGDQVAQAEQILGEKRNLTEFIRRVPHVLCPRALICFEVPTTRDFLAVR